MIDWIYAERQLICNGKVYEFKQAHADVINILLIAEGRVSNIDLFKLLYPTKPFNIIGARHITGMIGKINKILVDVKWQIKCKNRHNWIDCGVEACAL